MYKGGEGYWSWIFHRITGVGVALFLFIHVADTFIIGWGPGVYNAVTSLYRNPVFKIAEVILVAAVLYHALNGIRVILVDFWGEGVLKQRGIFWAEVVVFVILFVPTAILMLSRL